MNRAKTFRMLAILSVLTVLLMSLPFLVPGCGVMALVGLVPLLVMERIATREGLRRFWIWHYGTFLLWNAVTTWWVANATLGGSIFAMTANALQMSLVFGFFRLVKKRIGGVIPFLLLPALWIAWERWYLVSAEISWPWLVLGNAFAGDIPLIQWYEYTGTLGGSLWVWSVNLGLYGLLVALTEGTWKRLLPKARVAAITALSLALAGPLALSLVRWYGYEEQGEPLPVLVVQPNINPYAKFQAALQDGYDEQLCAAVERELAAHPRDGQTLLVVAPETFTWGMDIDAVDLHPTHLRLSALAARHPEVAMNILYGASTYSRTEGPNPPSRLARRRRGGWEEQHNTALMTDASGRADYYYKSKLVVGVEATPYPAVFVPVDDWLGGMMGRNVGQMRRTALDVVTAGAPVAAAPVAADAELAMAGDPAVGAQPAVGAPVATDAELATAGDPAVGAQPAVGAPVAAAPVATDAELAMAGDPAAGAQLAASGPASGVRIPVGCAVCYESVYGEFCTEYVRDAGAQLLAVITNDGWWGDSPGYRQHLRYSSLRAIETRRDIVRCGNTGISALIDQRGRIRCETPWWQPAVLTGEVRCSSATTFFVRHGDIVGRLCVFITLLLSALWLVRLITGRRDQ